MDFKIEDLDSTGKTTSTGPGSSLDFLTTVAQETGIKINLAARIRFSPSSVLNHRIKGGGYTAYDHLIIGMEYDTDLLLALLVNEEDTRHTIAMASRNRPKPDLMDSYREASYARKPGRRKIKQIFDHLFENPHLLQTLDLITTDHEN